MVGIYVNTVPFLGSLVSPSAHRARSPARTPSPEAPSFIQQTDEWMRTNELPQIDELQSCVSSGLLYYQNSNYFVLPINYF